MRNRGLSCRRQWARTRGSTRVEAFVGTCPPVYGKSHVSFRRGCAPHIARNRSGTPPPITTPTTSNTPHHQVNDQHAHQAPTNPQPATLYIDSNTPHHHTCPSYTSLTIADAHVTTPHAPHMARITRARFLVMGGRVAALSVVCDPVAALKGSRCSAGRETAALDSSTPRHLRAWPLAVRWVDANGGGRTARPLRCDRRPPPLSRSPATDDTAGEARTARAGSVATGASTTRVLHPVGVPAARAATDPTHQLPGEHAVPARRLAPGESRPRGILVLCRRATAIRPPP